MLNINLVVYLSLNLSRSYYSLIGFRSIFTPNNDAMTEEVIILYANAPTSYLPHTHYHCTSEVSDWLLPNIGLESNAELAIVCLISEVRCYQALYVPIQTIERKNLSFQVKLPL